MLGDPCLTLNLLLAHQIKSFFALISKIISLAIYYGAPYFKVHNIIRKMHLIWSISMHFDIRLVTFKSYHEDRQGL